MLSNYIYGILYGDGHFQVKEGYKLFYFSTTHVQIADFVEEEYKKNNIKYSRFTRDYHQEEKDKWADLHIIETYDKKLYNVLKEKLSTFQFNSDFLRGYFETKGTLFEYKNHGKAENKLWRIAISGTESDIRNLDSFLRSELKIATSTIIQRQERAEQGVISESFRLPIQNKDGIETFINYIEGGQTSIYLQDKMDRFKKYMKYAPKKAYTKPFKHYRNAVGYMANILGLDIKGKRGGGGKRGYKPVYIWENDEPIQEFRGWIGAYEEVSKIYESETGLKAPIVIPEDK